MCRQSINQEGSRSSWVNLSLTSQWSTDAQMLESEKDMVDVMLDEYEAQTYSNLIAKRNMKGVNLVRIFVSLMSLTHSNTYT